MKNLRMVAAAFVVLFVALLLPGFAKAQTSSGTLVGTVTDASGASVPGVSVTAISKQYGFDHVAVTDSLGSYRIDGLQPGVYSVTFSAAGFNDLVVNYAILSGSVTTTIDGKLQVAAVKSTVEVNAGAAQTIDTQSGQLGESLGHVEVGNLPYTTFNPAELAMTLPGVQDVPSNAGYTNGVGFSVNGTRPRANNFLIDGQDDNDNSISGQAFQPSNVGAVQEVSILTNSYSAEYGRGGGSVTNYIYKSGSNSFHGDAWEINRNSAFASIPAQDKFLGATSNPRDNENTFGFDIGGPVLRNKLFFFGTMQWDRERQIASLPQISLPTAAGIATLQSLPPNPNIALLLAGLGNLVSPGLVGVQNIPLGNDPNGNPRPSVQEGFFQQTGISDASNDRQSDFRLDWNMGPRDTITASYLRDDSALNPDFFANSAALPQWQTLQGGPSQLFRGQWLHTVSNVLVNEMRFSYTNIQFAFTQTAGTLAGPLANIPEIDFGSDIGFPSLGVSSGFPQGRGHKTWQAQEALSYTVGRHTLKGGIDLTFLSVHDEVPFNSRGDLSYNSGGGYSSLGNFIDDFSGTVPGGASKVFGNPVVNPNTTLYMPYIQDTWRVKDNLTLDLGLRYEYWGTLENYLQYPAINIGLGFGVPGGVFPNMYSSQQKPDKNNFAPRVGFAYTPHWSLMRGLNWVGDGKTVLRGGYGIFYDGMFTNIVDNAAGSVPNANGGSLVPGTGRGLANLSSSFLAITPTLSPTATTSTIANNLVNPMTQQWNVDVERELPGKFVLTAAYVGTRGEHLYANTDLNGGTGQFDSNGNIIRLNTNFGEIGARTNAGDSWYNSGQLELERRFRTDFTMRASYTYSKFTDDTSEVFTTTGLSSYPQNLECQKCDWGASAFDRRHRFNLAYVWQLPYSKENWLLKALTDRWQSASNITLETGTPENVNDGYDNFGNGHPNARPNVGDPSKPLSATGIDGLNLGIGTTPGTYYSIQQCFFNGICNPQSASDFRFVIPFSGYGNVGRNSVFGPGQVYVNTSIERNFPLPIGRLENQSLKFRVELFNAFNHPNLFTPSYAMISNTYGDTAATISGGRQIKFWLMYSF